MKPAAVRSRGHSGSDTPESLRLAIERAWVVLPASVTGGAAYQGLLQYAPATRGKTPVVLFLHGSSGIAPAIREWQKWLAESLGIASLTADSMQLPGITYKSPIAATTYEQVEALPRLPWADASRFVVAGTSEGAVSVARYEAAPGAPLERGRIIYSWSCEDNYHVQGHRSHLPASVPVLNVMSSTDVFFSSANPWLGNPRAQGHCAAALQDNNRSTIVLIPGAPHTLSNLPQARQATEVFLRTQLQP
ncbi:hypothetical protein [Variovorax paradoxus]|nr:hypothetical protein [Variovorax paradoxus]